MTEIEEILKKLGLSDAEIRVFLALSEHGSLSAQEITKHARCKRPTAYYAIRQLMERGLAHKLGNQGIERFQAESGEALLMMIEMERENISALESEVKKILPSIGSSKKTPEGKPRVIFHEGTRAMKQAIMETLYCRGGHIDCLAPADNFFWQIGQEFSSEYIAERVRRNITTRNMWEKPLEPKILLQSYSGRAQVRVLPKTMHGHFRTTVFIYDETVMYISSVASGYVLVVHSKEHLELMLALYDTIWNVSEPVKLP